MIPRLNCAAALPFSATRKTFRTWNCSSVNMVPIGDTLSGMGGPVQALREASPQARHFMQLVGASGVNFELREEA